MSSTKYELVIEGRDGTKMVRDKDLTIGEAEALAAKLSSSLKPNKVTVQEM